MGGSGVIRIRYASRELHPARLCAGGGLRVLQHGLQDAAGHALDPGLPGKDGTIKKKSMEYNSSYDSFSLLIRTSEINLCRIFSFAQALRKTQRMAQKKTHYDYTSSREETWSGFI